MPAATAIDSQTAAKIPIPSLLPDKGPGYVINWYFPPTANRSETFTLGYTVRGGLRYYEGGDQLWWQAI